MKDSFFYTLILILVFFAGAVTAFSWDISLSNLANYASILSALISLGAVIFAVHTVSVWKKPLKLEITLENTLVGKKLYSHLTSLSVQIFESLDENIDVQEKVFSSITKEIDANSGLLDQVLFNRYTLTHQKTANFLRMERAAMSLSFAMYDLEIITKRHYPANDEVLNNRLNQIRDSIDSFIILLNDHRKDLQAQVESLSVQ
jgi:hypothetical protein